MQHFLIKISKKKTCALYIIVDLSTYYIIPNVSIHPSSTALLSSNQMNLTVGEKLLSKLHPTLKSKSHKSMSWCKFLSKYPWGIWGIYNIGWSCFVFHIQIEASPKILQYNFEVILRRISRVIYYYLWWPSTFKVILSLPLYCGVSLFFFIFVTFPQLTPVRPLFVNLFQIDWFLVDSFGGTLCHLFSIKSHGW